MHLRKSAYGDEVCVRHVTEGMWGQECVYCAVVGMEANDKAVPLQLKRSYLQMLNLITVDTLYLYYSQFNIKSELIVQCHCQKY